MPTTIPGLQASAILASLKVFVPAGQVTELRALHVGTRRAVCTTASDLEALAINAAELDRAGARGVYFTPNPLRPDLVGGRASARKEDVLARHWLLIDADPIRPADCSSTETERAAAWAVLDRCRGMLDGAGLLGAVVGDSGNGWHLCYPIDLPNDDASQELVKAVLVGLGKRCNDELAQVDGKTFDAVRIWKLYGTTARKGPNTPERPHRLTRIVEGQPWSFETAQANNGLLRRLLEMWRWIDDTRKGRPAGDLIARAKAYIAKEPPAISGQRGHDRCFHVACVLIKDFGLSVNQAFEAIQDWNRTCQPPWSDAELRHKLQDAVRKEGPVGRLVNGNGHHEVNGTADGSTAPPAQTSQGEPWERPIPLNTAPDVQPFPLDVFPAALVHYVQECAWATNTPPDFTAGPLLAVAAGAIGNARRLAITRTHTQPACLFLAVIGPPGSGKSTPLDLVKEPLERAEHAFHLRWKEAVERWKETGGESPKPPLRRCLMDETTTEGLVRVLTDSNRGLVMIKDELSSLVTGMNQYKDGGKGSDRQVYLKIWSGATIRVDRKSQEGIPVSIRRPLACIVGGIQPGVIDWFRGEKKGDAPPPDDGFLDRFLVCYPTPLPAQGEQWRDVSLEAAGSWEAIVNVLLELEMVQQEDRTSLPQFVHLNQDGRAAWARLTQEHADEVNAEDFPEWLAGPWAKLVPGYAGRLALVLHLLRWACGDATHGLEVDGESVARAFRLVSYFKDHFRKLSSAMGSDPRVGEARHILQWLARNPDLAAFSRSDLYADLRRRFKTPESLTPPLDLLCQHRYLRRIDLQLPPGPGRKPTPRYEVSPLWERQRIQTIQTIAGEG